MKYPKINSVFERDRRGNFTSSFACPEFEYLADNRWEWTEKVDGTNLRIYPQIVDGVVHRGSEHTWIRGRNDNSQLPPHLFNAVVDLLRGAPFEAWMSAYGLTSDVVLYGEGYGSNIQSGQQYRPDPSFVLFDVNVGGWWLSRSAVVEVGLVLGLDVVPHVATETLNGMISAVRAMALGEKAPFLSGWWARAVPEGVVGRPLLDLCDRKGERIITKLKFRDFRN